MPTTIGRLLVAAADRRPDADALVVDAERRSYSALLGGVTDLAGSLVEAGIDRGDRVGILLPNSVEFVEALLATSLLGAVAVPMHSRFRRDELQFVTTHAALRAVMTMAGHELDLASRFADAWTETPAPCAVIDVGGPRPTGAEALPDLDRVGPNDPAMVLYTSGSTARPKGCVHLHQGLVRNAINMGRTRFFLTGEDRFFDPLPMFHVGFLLPMLATIEAGATMVGMGRFEGASALDLLERERATWLFAAFPALVNDIIDHPSFPLRDLSRVRMSMSTGAPATLRKLQEALPQAIQISTYGSTETGGVIVYHLPTASPNTRATTCGTPMDGVELGIVDPETGQHVAPGELGEIVVRGYSVMSCYLDDPAATAGAIDADGWFYTGDVGALDETGTLTFVGRHRDMLKVGGENVSPAEVEALIQEHPAVALAQVVGAPDARLDETAFAFVELRPGASATPEEIIGFCTGRLASFKLPRRVHFVTEWPMSATKVRKDDLRLMARELLERA